jgi:hypothetical protein
VAAVVLVARQRVAPARRSSPAATVVVQTSVVVEVAALRVQVAMVVLVACVVAAVRRVAQAAVAVQVRQPPVIPAVRVWPMRSQQALARLLLPVAVTAALAAQATRARLVQVAVAALTVQHGMQHTDRAAAVVAAVVALLAALHAPVDRQEVTRRWWWWFWQFSAYRSAVGAAGTLGLIIIHTSFVPKINPNIPMMGF